MSGIGGDLIIRREAAAPLLLDGLDFIKFAKLHHLGKTRGAVKPKMAAYPYGKSEFRDCKYQFWPG